MGLKKLANQAGESLKGAAGFALGAAGQLGSDSFAEYFRCINMDNNTLMMPGEKVSRKVGNTGKSANANGTENLISDGSVFDVAKNQCAILVENGKVHDCIIATTDELTGQYTYKSNLEPSWLSSNGEVGFTEQSGMMASLKQVAGTAWNEYKHRMAFGGQSTNTMSLFYINLKPLINLKVGAGNIMVRDRNIRTTIKLGVHGTIALQIANPVFFYENWINNPTVPYMLNSADGKELYTAIKQVVTGNLKGIVTNIVKNCDSEWWDFTNHHDEISKSVMETVGVRLFEEYGFTISRVMLECDIDEDQLKKLEEFDETALRGSDADYLRGKMMMSQANAMEKAASNSGGAMMGIMGMNGMMQAGNNGMMGSLSSMPQRQVEQPAARPTPQPVANTPATPPADVWTCSCGTENTTKFCGGCGATKPTPKPAPKAAGGTWTCSCGTENTTKFCAECGSPKPAPVDDGSWTCSCGAMNKTKFCAECGSPKPANKPKTFRCDKCGWVPADETTHPKFCPECGDIFDTNDEV